MIASNMTFEKFMERVNLYIHRESDHEMLEKAYTLAYKQHTGQVRKSGEPYIIHPLEVAYILAELNAGPNTLVAGLLHDIVEDTPTTLPELKQWFNEDVMTIVDGVTKIGKLTFSGSEPTQADNHQKMLLAMARDIRVIIVKIADRLHNMRTIHFMPDEKKHRIAKETLDIYAPIAHRLGMFKIKAELEDRSLRYVDPIMYHKIFNLIKSRRSERETSIEDMIEDIKGSFLNSGLNDFKIKGRIKNIYSIYKKMRTQNKDFEDIYDLLAIRIIVDKVEQCYQALGIIHAHYTPIPKRFKDYIAVPKPNLYQSLHTTVIGEEGAIFEIQIRTDEMDQIAEYGVAAHWAYKESKEYSKEREQFEIAKKLKWYAELLRMAEDSDESKTTAAEFVDTIKGDIIDANVYVFTPKGEVIGLPTGATPLDFAYRIHTDIGHKTVGAIVNNKMVPLEYELKTGDIVSMKTNKNSFGPSEDWLKIVKTSHAKHKIRAFLNKQNRDVLVNMGKQELDRELASVRVPYILDDQFVRKNFTKNAISTLEDMYAEIGKNILSPKTVVAKLIGTEMDKDTILQRQMEKVNRILTTNSETGVVVEGLANPQIKLANCCNPIPGDKILGYITKGSGIVVHGDFCNNIQSLESQRFMELEWATDIKRKYPCRIVITASERKSLLNDIVNVINASNLQIASISAVNNPNFESIVRLKILTANTHELETLIVNLKKVSDVYHIERESR